MAGDPHRRAAPWLCAGALALVALLIALFSLSRMTAWQAGAAPDGMSYLGAASNLQDGRGITGPFATSIDPFGPAEAAAFDGAVPFIQWPPLYPAVLALVSPGDVDPRIAAGLFNALAFGLLVGGVAGISTRLSGSVLAGAVAGLLLVAQPDVLLLHLLVAAEPLFLVLLLAGTWCLARRLSGASGRWLVAAFALAGSAALTRYAGLPVVVAFAAAIALWDRGSARQRVLRATGGLAAALPTLAWSWWTSNAAGVSNRRLVVQAPDDAQWRFVVENVLRWVSPPDAVTAARAVVVGAVVVTLIGAAVALVAAGNRRSTLAGGEDPPSADAVDEATAWLRVVAVVAPAYVAGVVATHVLFDRGVPIGGRLMVPLLPWLLPVIAVGVVRLVEAAAPRHQQWVTGALVVVAAAVILPVGSGVWDVTGRDTVRPPAEQTATADYLRSLDTDALVVSNDPALVWFTSGQEAIPVPRRSDAPTGVANDAFDVHLAEAAALLEERAGAVVLYRTATLFGPHFARVEDFEAHGFAVVKEGDEAVVLERSSSE
ncbi:MAG: glycosyltransferase family 39 protein [Acidimicrobiia bacterium]|nr:glycosyltransferase family 39 protein [Acidimicrobiia bacterium]